MTSGGGAEVVIGGPVGKAKVGVLGRRAGGHLIDKRDATGLRATMRGAWGGGVWGIEAAWERRTREPSTALMRRPSWPGTVQAVEVFAALSSGRRRRS